MRNLSSMEVAQVSGAGTLGLGVVAGAKLAVHPLLKVSITAHVAISADKHGHC